jgi:hypothetical protein
MTGMICRKSMTPCQTPGMCSPHGGCSATEQVSSAWLAQLRSEYVAFGELNAALKAENVRLLDQVKVLQSDANSWQSGYDEGRRMGAKGGRK